MVFSIGIICLTACRDDGTLVIPGTDIGTNQPLPEPTDTFYVDQELKSYYFFPQGSWWVYKRIDTNALIYDTAVVAYQDHEIKYNEVFPFAWEAAGVVIEHTYYKAPPGFARPNLGVGIGNNSGYTDRISLNSAGLLFPYLPKFFSTPIDSMSIANKVSPVIYSKLIDTNQIRVQGKLYNSIHLISGISNFEYQIWLSKNIGLIKYLNVDDSTSWELVNYQIN